MSKFRICMAGPSGTGKTTLATKLAEYYGLNFISGSGLKMLNTTDKSDEKSQRIKSHRELINESSRDPYWGWEMQTKILKVRTAIIEKQDHFIIDRSPLDNFTYSMIECAHNIPEEDCKSFLKKCQDTLISNYDMMILVRFNNPDGSIEENGSRITNPFFQEKADQLFLHYYHKYFNDLVPTLIIDYWDLDGRVKNSINFINKITL